MSKTECFGCNNEEDVMKRVDFTGSKRAHKDLWDLSCANLPEDNSRSPCVNLPVRLKVQTDALLKNVQLNIIN